MSARRLIAPLVAVLLLPAAPAAGGPLHGPTKLKLLECETGGDQADRFAVFEGEMKLLAGAARMQMRVTLQARTSDREAWDKVAAPGFGSWIAATPGVRRFVYTKRVENLVAPAQYRVVARYRWLNAAGATLARDERRTQVCRQPDQRANLTPARIDVEPGTGRDTRRYVIPVVNEGGTGASGFALRLTVNGQEQPLAPVTGLAAGERTLLSIEGPACLPGSTVKAVVDAGGVVDEADEDDNGVTTSCPSDG